MQLIDEQLAPFFLRELGVAPSGWRWAFVLFGSVGLVWAVFFWFGYRDDPEKHPRINAAELAFIRRGRTNDDKGAQPPVPWRLVFSSCNVWLMGLIMSCSAYCSYFYMSWFPKYLQAGRGVAAERSGLLSSLVLAGGALGSVVGGFCIDYVMRRTGQKRARPVLGAVALGLAGLLVLGSLACENADAASAVVALAFLVNMLMIASWWGVVADISGRHGATLFGLMNSLGIVGAVSSQHFTDRLADSRFAQGFRGRDQWDPALFYMAGVLFIGMVAWLFVNPHRSAVEPSHAVAD
jgi:MFS transporter, ACS family, glucarate transporter